MSLGRANLKRIFSSLFLLIFLSFINVSCDDNQFEERGEVTNSSLLVDAKVAVNEQRWEDALFMFSQMDTDFRDSRKNAILYSSAFAGLCGLNLITVLDAAENRGAQSPILFMMAIMAGSELDEVRACSDAERVLEENTSSDPTQRTETENILHSLILLGRIGSLLNNNVDTTGPGGVLDGVPDIAANTACLDSVIPEIDVRNIGVSLVKLVNTVGQLTNSVVGGLTGEFEQVCDSINSLDPNLNFCAITDPNGFNANHLRAIRSIVQEGSAFGMNTCVPPSPPFPVNSPPNLQNCICL